ncbi:MAG: AEC family transporter [Lachnospirales bacterium]
MFLTTFYTMCSLIIILGIGYYLSVTGKIDDNLNQGFSYLLTNVTLPCTILMALNISMDSVKVHEIFLTLGIYFAYFIIVMIVSYGICKLLKVSDHKNGVIVTSLAFGNFGFIGFPLVEQIVGVESKFFVALAQIPFNLLLLSIGVYLLQGDSDDKSFSFKKLMSPGFISVIIGLFMFSFQVKFPYPIETAIGYIAGMTTPLSLLILGKFLSDLDFKETFMDKEVLLISTFNLIIIPIIFMVIFGGVTENHILLTSSITLFALPSGTLVTIFAKNYGADYILASKLVFVSTVYSVITIPAFVTILTWYLKI